MALVLLSLAKSSITQRSTSTSVAILAHAILAQAVWLESRSAGFCLCSASAQRSMAGEDGDCVVHVVSAFSDESLCRLQLPGSSTVLDVKRCV